MATRIRNRHRIERATEVIEDYQERWDRGEPPEDVLSDLVADLMHWCHKHGDIARNNRLSWPEIEARAAHHFEEELFEESTE
jgi:hypothetical protein